MLTQTIKRKIDTARDILVGKVPDPKAQVEQITTALIYKFMDDMDQEAVELGGKPRFFTKGYEKYSWTKLLDSKVGGQERLNLYLEAITSFSQNPHLPQLFRDIFKDAFLPYRDPETLNLFLKEINGFTYDHSEDLGDAFEYLLSVLGSQGEAGQFRTPRHIIDFIVAAVDPTKDETVCDPACGTAGFLISAYKHILRQHDCLDDPEHKEKPLNPDERKMLMNHFSGYDISPDMVRLSKVNMYLHGFPNPTIYEYDTLTSEEKWDESFDVMLANPPFMTPKGGIKPHKRFSVQANRSEVLFVDYILEHLRPNGRAGIIVPEGIVFQTVTAYKVLRKLLVEDGLLAVISLPSGVFNPYAGVKTSILVFDKPLARKSSNILFLKIQNDGFDLGAQRQKIGKNDLPPALDVIRKYKTAINSGEFFVLADDDKKLAHLVPKEKIAENGEYNLTGDRYKESITPVNQKWPNVKLTDLCEKILSGGTPSTAIESYWEGNTPWITSADIVDLKRAKPRRYITQDAIENSATNLIPKGNIVVVTRVGLGKLFLNDFDVCISQDSQGLIIKRDIVIPEFLLYVLSEKVKSFENTSQGSTIQGVTKSQLSFLKIPLPPLNIQKEIVRQIEVKHNIVEAAKSINNNLKVERYYFGQSLLNLKDARWVKLGEVAEFVRGPFGGSLKKEIFKNSGYLVYEQNHAINNDFNFGRYYIDDEKFNEMKRFEVFAGDLLISCSGTMGKIAIVPQEYKKGIINQALLKLTPHHDVVTGKYLALVLEADFIQNKYFKDQSGSSIQNVASVKTLKNMEIPLPDLEIQEQLVQEILEQEKMFESNLQLINAMQEKISKLLREL